MKKHYLLFSLTLLLAISCKPKNEKLLGHWFLVASETKDVHVNSQFSKRESSDIKYLELMFSADSVMVNSNGMGIVRSKYTLYEQDSIQIDGFHFRYEIINDVNLVLTTDNTSGKSRYKFLRASQCLNDFSNKDIFMFRRFKYYASKYTEEDDMSITNINSQMWWNFCLLPKLDSSKYDDLMSIDGISGYNNNLTRTKDMFVFEPKIDTSEKKYIEIEDEKHPISHQ